MLRRFTLSFLVTTLIAGAALGQETFSIDKSHSEVGFDIRHLISRVHGRFTDFNGLIRADFTNPEESSVEFTIVAASINTDNQKRDNHLRSADFFDVEKFPQIVFRSTSVKAVGKNRYEVTGNFTMHGVTKAITIPVEYLGRMKDPGGRIRAGFEAELTLDRTDYDLVWNRAIEGGGNLLADDVKISISLEAPLQAGDLEGAK